jgi:hypothetical protein
LGKMFGSTPSMFTVIAGLQLLNEAQSLAGW